MKIYTFSIGFLEVPQNVTLNLYVLGCKRNCTGCCNPMLQAFEHPEQIVLNSESFAHLVDVRNELIDGICWLGGDAIYQSKSLVKLNKSFKEKYPAKFVCLYTGESFEKLPTNIKECTDIIIDGPWEGKMVSEPQTNQKIWHKTNNEWQCITYGEFANKGRFIT